MYQHTRATSHAHSSHGGRPAHRGSFSRGGRPPQHAGGGYRRPGGGGPMRRGPSRFARRRPVARGLDTSRYIHSVKEENLQADVAIQTGSFQDMPICEELKLAIAARGYVTPSPIQDKVIIPIVDGRDVVGVANTGTGKTGAFLIPLLERLKRKEIKKVLIIVPTRELAQQIQLELKKMMAAHGVRSALCIGGASSRHQMIDLRKSPHFVIGTPGRLKDFTQQCVLNLAEFQAVVLDEVDRMVDMGFIEDITHLLSLLPKERQSLFFSATVSPEVARTITRFAKDPVTVTIPSRSHSHLVEQNIVRVPSGSDKVAVLEELLEKDEFKKTLIFGRTKHGVERLARHLHERGFKASSIHGDKPQRQREQAIRLFREDAIDILVATDVAARGIDITDISHVINYDEPATQEDYIHRIGRTGRANKKGFALTFVG